MPATSHALTRLPPSHLYLDTNVFLSHLVSTDVHHQPATQFFVHLATCNVTTLYISALTSLFLLLVIANRSLGILEAVVITCAIVYMILDVRTELQTSRNELQLLKELEKQVALLIRS